MKGLREQKDQLEKSEADQEQKAKKIRKLNEASLTLQENNYTAVYRSLLVNADLVKKEQKAATSEGATEEKKVERPY